MGMTQFIRVLIVSGSTKEEKMSWLMHSSGTRRHLIYYFHLLSDSSQVTVLVLQGCYMRKPNVRHEKNDTMPLL